MADSTQEMKEMYSSLGSRRREREADGCNTSACTWHIRGKNDEIKSREERDIYQNGPSLSTY